MFRTICISLTMWPVLFSLASSAEQVASEVAADEVVALYPTYAHRTIDEKSWILHIHGRIYEPEQNSLKRAALLSLMRRSFGLSREDERSALFNERVRTFLVDNERNKTIHIRLGDNIYRAGKSGPNGHFASDLVLSNEEIHAVRSTGKNDNRLWYTAFLPSDDRRTFAGEIELIESHGLSLISDIDDTIKITEVTDRRALLANTFLGEFKPVPGMSDVYRYWESRGAQFHYISASPWQLYEPVAEFLKADSFPTGSMHMKVFRLKDRSALALLATQHEYKSEIIEKILSDFPQRQFILIGDGGEQDPEIYGELARRHSNQVLRIWIRETAKEQSDRRFQLAFKALPRDRWQVFREPSELPTALQTPLAGGPKGNSP